MMNDNFRKVGVCFSRVRKINSSTSVFEMIDIDSYDFNDGVTLSLERDSEKLSMRLNVGEANQIIEALSEAVMVFKPRKKQSLESAREEQSVKTLHTQGMSVRKIASKVGWSKSSVHRFITKLNKGK
jgi:predicted transcriptional regulator YheO